MSNQQPPAATRQKRPRKHRKQEYDNSLKALFGEEVKEILPLLLPEAEYIDEQNIEIDRTMLKADLVFRGKYKRRPHMINMELQTGRDDTMEMRLLAYHSALHLKHKLPVLSVILYLFEIKNLPQPPYREKGGDGTLVTFKYRLVQLCTLNAPDFVRRQAVCLYTLLPGMQGATAALLKEALKAMKKRYTRRQFERHLIRFHEIMIRSTTMTKEDKREIEEVLKMEYKYDFFIDENADVLKRVERGKAEAELKAFRRAALSIIEHRFPALVNISQPRLEQIRNTDELNLLVVQLAIATNEMEICQLLHIQPS